MIILKRIRWGGKIILIIGKVLLRLFLKEKGCYYIDKLPFVTYQVLYIAKISHT